jgi:EAL domain-containing protein (putative c-di-GMP-specific phosphodiesterase class I)
MREACIQARAWQDAGLPPMPMAVNVSATEFHDKDFVASVRRILDVLKIDQSFVHQMTTDSEDSTIVSAIINMGKGLKHLVVAEGIETQAQRAYLQSQFCQEGRGYLFNPPLAAAQFAHLLQTGLADAVVH